MESLHAPWRIQYILAPKPPSAEAALFTRITQSNDDVANYVLALERRCYAVLNPYGFNIGVNLGRVAGAGITEHLHIHVVPRWNGDTNFMPVLAGTTVLPEALTELAAKLRAALAQACAA